MEQGFQTAMPLLEIPVTSADEIDFAERAVWYLEKQALDHESVVQILVSELDLDLETAEALADLAA